jgi:hypothetical protein
MNQLTLDTRNQRIKNCFIALSIFLLFSIATNPTWAVTVQELIEPIQNLKTEIFSGWMTVVKVCAAATGIVLSAFRGSLMPFAIGAGLSAGIHLYDSYLGDVAAGALI